MSALIGFQLFNILGVAVGLPIMIVRVMLHEKPLEVLLLWSRTQNITLADEILLWVILLGVGWVLGMLSYEHFIPCTQACIFSLEPLGGI